jgi:hypothetical protein
MESFDHVTISDAEASRGCWLEDGERLVDATRLGHGSRRGKASFSV